LLFPLWAFRPLQLLPPLIGLVYGTSDEFGYAAVENMVYVHDLHATILHLLGIDHERRTFRNSGRDFRLTDVSGHVVRDILA